MTDSQKNILVCSRCKREYPDGTTVCPEDQAPLAVKKQDTLIGTTFVDKYQILELIGEGGMSKVYKARHLLMKRIVAVKLLHEDATDDTMARARFQLEAEAASALSHPNVVTVHDFGVTSGGQAYFIMDCLIGRGLDDILAEKGTLPIDQALEIFAQACEGLEHAHRKGIIHRDVKPSNLVIVKQEDGSDLVKIVDFGIAKMVKAEKSQQLTHTGEIFGTPLYMSPEQCHARTLDARSDLYSFGCLMYEVLTGDPPLIGDTFINTVVKQINEVPKTLNEAAPDKKIPPAIDAVIMKCLEKNPDNRYASAAELRQALFDAGYQSGLKGLRAGAVPEYRRSGQSTATGSRSPEGALTLSLQKNRLRLFIIGTISGVFLSWVAWFVFVDSGTSGDGGTIWQQCVWQAGILEAEKLVAEKRYEQAQRVLEVCFEQAQVFNDDSWRELTLNRLVEAAGLNRDFEAQKSANDRLADLVDIRNFREYDLIMGLLREWAVPSGNEVKQLDRQQRALAYGERISKLAEQLSKCSVQKQQSLLDLATDVYEDLKLKGTPQDLRFRLALAECLGSQQRIGDMIELLNESLALFPEKLQTSIEEQLKAKMLLSLGQGECLQATDKTGFAQAARHLEEALSLAAKTEEPELSLISDCKNALAGIYRLFHTAEYDAKAAALEAGSLPRIKGKQRAAK